MEKNKPVMGREYEMLCAAYECSNSNFYVDAFRDGAKWADAHPYWRKTGLNSIKYDKPTIGERYNVILRDNLYEVQNAKFYGDFWDINGKSYKYDDVIAWINLPKLPKFN